MIASISTCFCYHNFIPELNTKIFHYNDKEERKKRVKSEYSVVFKTKQKLVKRLYKLLFMFEHCMDCLMIYMSKNVQLGKMQVHVVNLDTCIVLSMATLS